MIVLPDGKVCRNLPEQVAENLKKIQEIIHFLDGVNIQGNLVVIADLSQILTQAELEIVERPVAFIYYNDELYIKKNEDSGNAYFYNVFSLTASGSQIDFASNEIAVVLATGALSLTSATATTYPKSQIDSLLGAKASLTGADFIGAVKATTLEQSQFNYELSIPLLSATSLTITNIYNRFAVINSVLYLIVNFKLKNETASSITVGSGYGNVAQANLTIDSAVGSKIYDLDGNSAADTATQDTIISSVNCLITTDKISANNLTFNQARLSLCNRTAANAIAVQIALNGDSGSRISVAPSAELYITGRMSLTLL